MCECICDHMYTCRKYIAADELRRLRDLMVDYAVLFSETAPTEISSDFDWVYYLLTQGAYCQPKRVPLVELSVDSVQRQQRHNSLANEVASGVENEVTSVELDSESPPVSRSLTGEESISFIDSSTIW
jgi:hypothetical protein